MSCKYFISFIYTSKIGKENGCAYVEYSKEIEEMYNIKELINYIEDDNIKDVVILNIQRLPI